MPSDTEPSTASEIRTVSFVSLGCPKNLVDSERMLGSLAQDGLIPVSYHPTDDERWDDAGHTENTSLTEGDAVAVDQGVDPADAVVINTCGFLEASKEESMAVIRDAVRAKEAGRVKRVVVAGCLVQRHKAKMLDWEPGIDAMIGVFDRDHIIEAVRGSAPARESLGADGQSPKYWVASNALVAARDRGMQTTGLTVNGKDGKGVGYFEDDSARLRLTPRHYAYLRMSEGCNQACAFCTIPSIRGKMRSKPIGRVVAEARELMSDGVFELNLIGQDTTSYGDDIGAGWADSPADDVFNNGGLPQLLRSVSDAVGEAGGQGWVRLMYAYPSNFRDEFIDAFAMLCEQGHLLPYIDIPLQHASQRMLEQMRRHVSADQQAELMTKLRDRIPGLAIRTTFISGFPGETEQDHEHLLGFIEEVGFEALGVFEYSAEPGTPAGTMEQDPALAVPPEVKARRKGEIMALQQTIAFEQAQFIADQWDQADPLGSGVQLDILIDREAGVVGEQIYQGRAYHQAPQIDSVTYVQTAQKLAPGELVRCAIVGAEGYDLIARPLADLDPTVRLNILR